MHKVSVSFTLGLIAAQTAFGLHFVAFGDQRTNQGTAQTVIDAISKANPELVVVSGDLWDGYGSAAYKHMLMKNANLAGLLRNNLYLVARGNHESLPEVLAFSPTLVRGGKELYSFTKGNAFFVCLGMDPNAAIPFLEQQLQSPQAKAAVWKFAYSHYPVYSTGDHGAKGMPGVERICDKYGVNAFFSGHDHIYERTHQVYGGKVVDTGNGLTSGRGTVYIVTGGGGAPLYEPGHDEFSHVALKANNFTDVVTDEHQLIVKAYAPAGSVLDAFTMRLPPTLVLGKSRPLPAAIDVGLIERQAMAILSFAPIRGKSGSVKILSPLGRLVKLEALATGQTSLAWRYGAAAQGEYVAVIRDGGEILSARIPIRK